MITVSTADSTTFQRTPPSWHQRAVQGAGLGPHRVGVISPRPASSGGGSSGSGRLGVLDPKNLVLGFFLESAKFGAAWGDFVAGDRVWDSIGLV